jgi:hypothetical protein
MKRFIYKIIIFVGLLSLLTSIPCLVFEKRAKRCTTRHPYCRVNLAINSENINADLIIMGNSRAEYHYNDSILSEKTGLRCLNLGWAGYPFDYQYNVMYRNYMEQNIKPRFILQEISPYVFFDYFFPKYTIELLPFINRPEFKFYIELCPELSYLDKFIFVRYGGKLYEVCDELSLLETTDSLGEKWRNDFITKMHEVEKDTTIMNLFERFVDECKDQNIKLILIYSPMHTDNGEKYFNMDAFWSIISKVVKDRDVPVLNYHSLFGNDTTYFRDAVHLNKYGKDCFTRKVAHDLDSLGLIFVNQP